MPPATIAPTRSNQTRQSVLAIWRRNTKTKTIAANPNDNGQREPNTSSLLMLDSA